MFAKSLLAKELSTSAAAQPIQSRKGARLAGAELQADTRWKTRNLIYAQ